METETIQDATRLLMARSQAAAGALGRRSPASPIYQELYNKVASDALANPGIDMTADERDLVAQFITLPDEREARSQMLRVRLTERERADLQQMADAAGIEVSEFVRRRIFTE